MKPIVVIGLGNPLLSDEGIGVAWVREMMKHAADFPIVEFLDLGTSGPAILHALADREAAVILDCALMGQKPGTMRRFTPYQAVSRAQPVHFSLHENDLLSMIALSRQLGECPQTVLIFVVQPERVEPGEHLSPALFKRLPDYMRCLSKELRLLAAL